MATVISMEQVRLKLAADAAAAAAAGSQSLEEWMLADAAKDRAIHEEIKTESADRALKFAYRLWMMSRKAAIQDMIETAPWSMQPLPKAASEGNIVDVALDTEEVPRTIVALDPEAAAKWATRFEELRVERERIMLEYGTNRLPRTVWLPVFLDHPRAVVYQYNDAHSSFGAHTTSQLKHTHRDPETMKQVDEYLDVAAYCASQGWRPEDVTIRRSSGHHYVARVRWDDPAREELRSRANCLVLVLDEPAGAGGLVDPYHRKNARRSDKAKPDFHWHGFDFIHYGLGLRKSKPV